MSVQIKQNSWLVFSDLLNFNGVEFFEIPDFPDIVPQDGDLYLTVNSQYLNRLDLVAYDYYGDETLWWVLALANGYDQIPTDMRLNDSLRIPQKSYIDALISKGGVK